MTDNCRNAIITGARSGIGLATLKLFAASGINCWPVVHSSDSEWRKSIEQLQQQHNVWIKPVFMELENPDSIKQGIMEIRHEKKPVDILVNSAGYTSPDSLFAMTKMEEIRKVMEINFFSVIQLIQYVSRMMMPRKSGSIINIASIAAWNDDTSQMEYAASKSALVAATKRLAGELGAYNIRINAIAPGFTDTKMLRTLKSSSAEILRKGIALNRFALADEVARLCAFLASDASAYITGETIRIDGGGFDLRTFLSKN